MVVYLEAGSVPALLSTLRTIFEMNFMLQGALGGVMYLFISFAGPFAGHCMAAHPVRKVMGVTLLINMLATAGMGLTSEGYPYLLILMRSLIGFTQAFLMVFSPIWVDEFSPSASRTQWLSYLQASVPCGIMFGYLIATITVHKLVILLLTPCSI